MSAAAPPKARVLIAEDVKVLAMRLQRPLEQAGYAVEVVEDGDICVRRALENPPDLLLLDIMMPNKHGIQVLRELRADPRTKDLPVIVCSAKDFKTEREEAKRWGAVDYLIKPPPPELLLERVAAALGAGDKPPVL